MHARLKIGRRVPDTGRGCCVTAQNGRSKTPREAQAPVLCADKSRGRKRLCSLRKCQQGQGSVCPIRDPALTEG
jgi:hypothetical protein